MAFLRAIQHAGVRAAVLAVAVGTAFVPVRAQMSEYELKAAFLYNFARYVEWPPTSFSTPAAPLTICVLGRSPFGNSLEEVIAGKTVEGRSFAVRNISEASAPGTCHILFVSAAERDRFRALAATFRVNRMLIVGEAPGFITDGGTINFHIEDGKVRFEINADAAVQNGLRISSKLLSLARIVSSKEPNK